MGAHLSHSVGPTMRRRWRGVCALLLLGALVLFSAPPARAGGQSGASEAAAPTAPAISPQVAYGQLPLSFEANRGQADTGVDFLARGSGYALLLSGGEATFVLHRSAPPEADAGHPLATVSGAPTDEATVSDAGPATRVTGIALRQQFVGAAPRPAGVGLDALPGTVNYLRGPDPARWQTGVPTYAKVAYRDVYPGIDLVYYGQGQQLEYDLIVAPGADPGRVALRFPDAERLELDGQGDLLVHAAGGTVRQHLPVVYQEVDGARQPVDGGYVLREDGTVGFALGAYDPATALVIDPIVSYSTYLGGSGNDGATGIVVDGQGQAYVTGSTGSANFPTTAGAFDRQCGTGDGANCSQGDVFVTKLNAAGTGIVWSTFLDGGDDDSAKGIALEGNGNVVVAGRTRSNDFPTANALYPPAPAGSFVAKLTPDGSQLVYSTYLTTVNVEAVALDSTGAAYLTGGTGDTLITTPGAAYPNPPAKEGGVNQGCPFDGNSLNAFVSKLSPAGDALVYSTYLGGNHCTGTHGIAVDAAGNAYVVGQTNSRDYPTTPGAFNRSCCPSHPRFGYLEVVFVTKLNPAGSALVYSTFVGGGTQQDKGNAIAVDTFGRAYIVGATRAPDFPATGFDTTCGADGRCTSFGATDGFFAVLQNDATALLYSTFIGGFGVDEATGVALDRSSSPAQLDAAYVTGHTLSHDFPLKNPVQLPDANKPQAFVIGIRPGGSDQPIYSTVLGGSGTDVGRGIAVDGCCGDYNVYVAGFTDSANFLTTPNAFQPTCNCSGPDGNAFVTKLSGNATVADLAITQTDSPDPVAPNATLTYTLTITNNGPNPAPNVSVTDQLPNGATFLSAQPSQGSCAGGSTVTCNLGSLAYLSSATVTIQVRPQTSGSITNTATVTPTGQQDLHTGNNSASQTTTVSGGSSTCSPRPRVNVTSTVAGGRLQVTVASQTGPAMPANSLRELRFDPASNALIDVPNGPQGSTGGITVPLPAGTQQTTFFVRRQTAGQAATVPLTVVDECGEWRTLVGGGTATGF